MILIEDGILKTAVYIALKCSRGKSCRNKVNVEVVGENIYLKMSYMSGRREGREFKGKLAAGNQLRSIASGEEPSKFPLNKMEGEWHNPNSGHNGFIEVELVRMDSPTEGTIKVEWLPYCSRLKQRLHTQKRANGNLSRCTALTIVVHFQLRPRSVKSKGKSAWKAIMVPKIMENPSYLSGSSLQERAMNEFRFGLSSEVRDTEPYFRSGS